jgi:predicted aldo/keto reductase-like oxidoreductase
MEISFIIRFLAQDMGVTSMDMVNKEHLPRTVKEDFRNLGAKMTPQRSPHIFLRVWALTLLYVCNH